LHVAPCKTFGPKGQNTLNLILGELLTMNSPKKFGGRLKLVRTTGEEVCHQRRF
jgi:hypothetical protein